MRRPIPFIFENMWLKEEGFKEMVRDWWHSSRVSGTNSFAVVEKLKTLKSNMKIWNKNTFGRVEERKKEAIQRLDDEDKLESQRPLPRDELGEKGKAAEEYKKMGSLGRNHLETKI